MSRPALEVADIVRAHLPDLLRARHGRLTTLERRVLSAISVCRTSVLGGHVLRCDHCAQQVVSYNSCRNRHCPKCQVAARADWLAEREQDLLPVPYFHVVFTLPHELAPLAAQNPARLYGLLFRCAADTLTEIAADPRHLGARLGILAVLHTWSQTLQHHPHVHCVVPGGGPSLDGTRWIACRPGFFLPVRVLSRLFRGKLLAGLRALHAEEPLRLHGKLEPLRDPDRWAAFLRPLYEKKWVVYAKAPFGGPAHVLKYLARYTHRVAIGNSRLVSLHDGNVSFRYRDAAHRDRQRVMTVTAVEFLRRFLKHVLPLRFVRVRHYGFLANRCRRTALAHCRTLLDVMPPATDASVPSDASRRCPFCHRGELVEVRTLLPGERPPDAREPACHDTS